LTQKVVGVRRGRIFQFRSISSRRASGRPPTFSPLLDRAQDVMIDMYMEFIGSYRRSHWWDQSSLSRSSSQRPSAPSRNEFVQARFIKLLSLFVNHSNKFS